MNISHVYIKGVAFMRFLAMRYAPFGGDRFKGRAYLASLNVTDNCCLKCVMCNQWQTTHSGELKTEEWKDILAQLKAEGIREINLTGGEPLVRKDIFDLIGHARQLGLNVGMTSNAYLMNKANIARLVASGVSTFNVSMDAVDAKYDEIRGVAGAYARLLAACEELALKRKQEGVAVYLCFLLMKDTLADYKDVLALGEKLGLPVVINLFDINPYFFQVDGQKERFWIQEAQAQQLKTFQKFMVENKSLRDDFTYHSFSEIKYAADYFKDPLQKRLPCYVSQTRLCLGPKGEVFGGCWAMGVYGDLRKTALKDILRSKRFIEAGRKMFHKQCPGCSCGYSLNLRYAPRHILQEMLYRILPWTRDAIGREQ